MSRVVQTKSFKEQIPASLKKQIPKLLKLAEPRTEHDAKFLASINERYKRFEKDLWMTYPEFNYLKGLTQE